MTGVKALLEGRGFEPGEGEDQTVFNVVLERFMAVRGVETYDDLYAAFAETGYEMDFGAFYDACSGETEAMTTTFVRGVVDVLGLDQEETKAFAWAHLWGTE